MKTKVRNSLFETNSSSTHTLALASSRGSFSYIDDNSTDIKITIFNDESYPLTTLQEKLSYLVSHIMMHQIYDASNYDDIIEFVNYDRDYVTLHGYVSRVYYKNIVLPSRIDFERHDIEINHQLYATCFYELLSDILYYTIGEIHDKSIEEMLEYILDEKYIIEFGRD